MPPKMVAPARETPGTKANDCAKPICKACFLLMLSMVWVAVWLVYFSTNKIAKPPTIKAIATLIGENK